MQKDMVVPPMAGRWAHWLQCCVFSLDATDFVFMFCGGFLINTTIDHALTMKKHPS